MFSAFEKLPEEKKQKILSISIQEFADKGYDHTSTDTITSRAGISKGILFHYFKSKKNLYLYLFEHTIKLLTDKTLQAYEQIETNDFFERIKDMLIAQQRVAIEYDAETRFGLQAYMNPPHALKKEIAEIYRSQLEPLKSPDKLNRFYRFDLIEADRLRSDITANMVIRMTMTIIDQLSSRSIDVGSDVLNVQEKLLQEIDDYFKIMKYGIYESS